MHMLSMPPYSSKMTESLDKILSKPLKTNYDTVVDNWTSSDPERTVTLYHVAQLFKTAYEKTNGEKKGQELFGAQAFIH